MIEFLSMVKTRIRQSSLWTEKARESDKYINGLICPECGHPEAYCYINAPWAIICNRRDNCGTSVKIREIFPDLFGKIEKRYPSIEKDPHQPARVYLNTRGLKNSIDSLNFEYWKNVRGSSCGAVMFPVPSKNGKKVYNGRIIAPTPGIKKSHNSGSTAGCSWKHPAVTYDSHKEVFITEGIINALSWIELDQQAIAVLSTNADPEKIDLSGFQKLVFAFDTGKAGADCLKRWKEKYPDAKAILPVRGDWNDILTSRSCEAAKKYLKERRREFEFNARLALSDSAQQYTTIFHSFHSRAPGLFEFNGCYYFTKITGTEEEPKIETNKVSNFTISVEHYQLDTTSPDRPTNEYFLKIKPRMGRPIYCTVTAIELSSPHGLTQMFLQRSRTLWQGDKWASLALINQIVEAGAPVVRQLQVIGYDGPSKSYVFRKFAIDSKGKTIYPNKKEFFQLSGKTFVRPPAYPTIKPINGISPTDIYSLIIQAWPDRGTVAIAWTVASWFVNTVKPKLGFFPFLSFKGDPATGKSRLSKLLNALQCCDEEGISMSKSNTAKGELRRLAQVSGLFKALLEGNDPDKMRFELNSILNLYMAGNSLQTRALTTNDLQVKEIPFKSSLLFVQNVEPFRTKAQKERVISLEFKKAMVTNDSTPAFEKLIQIPNTELANFFPSVMKHRKQIESNWFEKFKAHKKELLQDIRDARLSENHTIILAFHDLLKEILKIDHDIYPYIVDIGTKKRRECSFQPLGPGDYILDTALQMEGGTRDVTHIIDKQEDKKKLWVYIIGMYKQFSSDGTYTHVQLKDAQKALQDHPAFLGIKSHRFNGKFRKAHVFNLNLIEIIEERLLCKECEQSYEVDKLMACSKSGEPIIDMTSCPKAKW